MTNTKARHKEILASAVRVLEIFGGVEIIDALPQDERRLKFREMALYVRNTKETTLDTARRNVTKALHQARHPLNDLDRWGGPGRNQGRLPMPEDQKREPVSTRLAPGSKELAQAIAQVKELPGWGRALDQALVKWVEGDPELKIKLAEMGIIVKGNNGEELK